MSSRQLTAVITGAITSSLLGYLVYGILLKSYLAAGMGANATLMREEPVIWAMAAAQVVFASLIVIIFTRWPGSNSFGSGAAVGALIGLLMAAFFDLIMFATTTLQSLKLTLTDPLALMVIAAGTGAVVGAILGRKTAAVDGG